LGILEYSNTLLDDNGGGGGGGGGGDGDDDDDDDDDIETAVGLCDVANCFSNNALLGNCPIQCKIISLFIQSGGMC
jgi:hypothetical protein